MTIYHLQQEDVWQRHIKPLISNSHINETTLQQHLMKKLDYLKMIRMQCFADNIYKSLILY